MSSIRKHFQCTPQYKRQIAPFKRAPKTPTLIEREGKMFARSAAGAAVFYRQGVPVLDPRIKNIE